MKICVILTGGTIGSTVQGGTISPADGTGYLLIDPYKDEAEFVTAEPYRILSETLTADKLTALIDCIDDALQSDCGGIIVAHGTDTLQYSAAAAAFCFGMLCKPIVFVSSALPLENKNANGRINFEAAVEFIKSGAGRGVFVSYANENDGTAGLHAASRILRHPEYSHRVYSLGGPYAVYDSGRISLCEKYVPSDTDIPCGRVRFSENSGLLSVTVSPYDDYAYDLSRYKAVMLVPYHSGTLNTADIRFAEFCTRARVLRIPIFVPDVPFGNIYESSERFASLGITAVHGIASIPLSVKIWIAVSNGFDVSRFVMTPIASEFTNEGMVIKNEQQK